MNAIDPGPGYRLLKEGEEIREGDEFYADGGWAKINSVTGKPYTLGIVPYRRKIESGWILLSQRLPDKFPCQVWGPILNFPVVATEAYNGQGAHPKGWPWVPKQPIADDGRMTHWRPLELAAPPEPEVPVNEDDEEFGKWYLECSDGFKSRVMAGDVAWGWRAALQWERSRKADEVAALKAKIEKAKSLVTQALDHGSLAGNFSLHQTIWCALKALEEP